MRPKIGLLKFKEYGKIAEIKQDVVSVTGMANCMNGQMVQLGESTLGFIVGFDQDYVLVLKANIGGNIKPGDPVVSAIDDFKVPVGDAFIGRMVNALCHPTDGGGVIRESAMSPIFNKARTVLERVPLDEVLQTGTQIVDMLKPVGKGQRMLILGDRMTGKTTVAVDAILSQKGKNVLCVYCCVGKSEGSLKKVTDLFDENDAWEYTTVLASTASDPIGQQYLAPYVACSIGEYFMQEEGKDVLIVFDDLTKHAWAYRQISLLLERAPGRDAYPGDIFYIHSQLVERAGKLKPELGGGSMTQLPIVETLQGDVAGYIPSNIVSMTDGQIFMSTGLFSEGFKPAIDMGLSVSRIGSKVQWPAMKAMTGMLQLDFVRYKELEKLTRLRAGVSGDVQKRLEQGRVLEEVLKQDQNRPMELEEQIIRLYALRNGLFYNVDPVDVRDLLNKFVAQVMRDAATVVVDLIKQTRLTDEIKGGLDEQLRLFSNTIIQNKD